MEWVCSACGRTYHDPPAACGVCGGAVVPPADPRGSTDRVSLRAARERLLDPRAADTSLVDVDPRIRFAFRVLAGVAVVVLAVVVGALLLG